MKRTEIAMTILIASAAMVAAFFITQSLFSTEIEREATVEVAEPITADNSGGLSISRRIFNEFALNPTVEVYVNGNVSPSEVVDMQDIEATIPNSDGEDD